MWDMADVVAPIADAKSVPHFPIRWDPSVAERYNSTFTVESTYQSYVDSLLRLLNLQNVKTIGLLVEEGQGWVLAKDYLINAAAQKGFQILKSAQYTSGDVDVRSIILRVTTSKPDYIVLLSNPPNTENLIARLKQIAPNQKFTGYFEVLQDPSIVEGIPFVAQFEVNKSFEELFKSRYGTLPKSRAPQAYDIIGLLSEVSNKNKKKLTLIDLSNYFSNFVERTGAAGRLKVTGQRTMESYCVWKLARDGQFVSYISN
jgi:ABC-type branched-subunit amino acid transport system substrate-binding protein